MGDHVAVNKKVILGDEEGYHFAGRAARPIDDKGWRGGDSHRKTPVEVFLSGTWT